LGDRSNDVEKKGTRKEGARGRGRTSGVVDPRGELLSKDYTFKGH